MSQTVTVQCIGHDGTRCHRMTSKTRFCPQHLADLGVEIKASGVDNAGEGLFAVRSFKKGENIVEYRGDTIIIMDPSSSDSDSDSSPIGPYVLQVKKNVYIDAAKTNSEGRYANSAPRGKKNNAQLVYDRRNRIAWVRAREKIAEGSEIWTAYGPGYWAGKRKT